MQLSREFLMPILREAVSDKELRESVIYIIPDITPGDEVTINRKKINIESPSSLLFIDMESGVNWSHKCKYVLVDNNDKVQLQTEGQFPPDTEKLKLFSKPEKIEDWMLLSNTEFK